MSAFAIMFLIIPIIWVVIVRLIWNKSITMPELGIHIGSVFLLSLILLSIVYWSATGDVEILHGQVVEKVRKNDSHMESYSCNCHTTCSGTGNNRTCHQSCDTCWRTVYTVDWYVNTTLGRIDIDWERSYYKSVWKTPDPERYVTAYVGEPCAKNHFYVNYLKSAPASLLNSKNYNIKTVYKLPQYPKIIDLYSVNNVINVDSVVDIKPYEKLLSDQLKSLGPKKQVNIILIFTKQQDVKYKYAVEQHWLTGKKNDVIIIIGTKDGTTIDWIDGFSFALSQGNKLLFTQIFDELRLKPLTTDIIPIITNNIDRSFVRKQMKDLEYLKNAVQPSIFSMVVLFMIQFACNIIITFICIKYDLFQQPYRGYR